MNVSSGTRRSETWQVKRRRNTNKRPKVQASVEMLRRHVTVRFLKGPRLDIPLRKRVWEVGVVLPAAGDAAVVESLA